MSKISSKEVQERVPRARRGDPLGSRTGGKVLGTANGPFGELRVTERDLERFQREGRSPRGSQGSRAHRALTLREFHCRGTQVAQLVKRPTRFRLGT